jgi:hypothetical protein
MLWGEGSQTEGDSAEGNSNLKASKGVTRMEICKGTPRRYKSFEAGEKCKLGLVNPV